jgi:hypothetical protein
MITLTGNKKYKKWQDASAGMPQHAQDQLIPSLIPPSLLSTSHLNSCLTRLFSSTYRHRHVCLATQCFPNCCTVPEKHDRTRSGVTELRLFVPFWDLISTLVRGGLTAQVAIDRIYDHHGRSESVMTIINKMKDDCRNGTAFPL